VIESGEMQVIDVPSDDDQSKSDDFKKYKFGFNPNTGTHITRYYY
jgi:hypothetical protein